MGEPNYDAGLFELLAAGEPRSFWYRSRAHLVVDVLRRYFPEAGSLLKVGCGTGYMLARIHAAYPSTRLTGFEPHEQGLTIARECVPEADFAHLDVLELEHELEFDVVCAFGLLEHLHDDRPALERMRRATRPGGGLVLLIPQHPWLWSETDVLAHHRRRYTRRELVSRVCSAGFEVVFASSFVATLLPAMVVARLAARISARRPDLVGEPEPRGLNRP